MTTTFAELNLRSDLLEALASLGYEEPTPIQSEAIPPLLAGKDLLGQAATGTGCSCPRASSPSWSRRRCTAMGAGWARG